MKKKLPKFGEVCILILLIIAVKSFIYNLDGSLDYSYLSQIPIKEFQLQISNSGALYTLKLHFNKTSSSWPMYERYVPAKLAVNTQYFNKRFITYADLLKIEEGHFRKESLGRALYQLFPLAADLPQIETVNYNSMRYLKIPSKVCTIEGPHRNDRFDIVVVVKTAVHNFERRQKHRATHAYIKANQHHNFRIGVVYSLGVPRTISSDKFHFNSGVTLKLLGPNGRFLKAESLNETRRKLAKEMEEYDDLIVGDYEDTYYNLTLKMMHSYYWFTYFCSATKPMPIYLDDDYAFNATYLMHLVTSLSPRRRENLVSGILKRRGPVVRFENSNFGWKWGQSRSEEPWPYHAPHLLGPVAVVGYSAARAMAITMSFTQFGRVDDAWLGILLAKLQIPIVPIKDCYVYRLPMNTTQVSFTNIDDFNDFVVKRGI